MRRVEQKRGILYVLAKDRHDLHRLVFGGNLKPKDLRRVYIPQDLFRLVGETVIVTRAAQEFGNIESFYEAAAEAECHLIRA